MVQLHCGSLVPARGGGHAVTPPLAHALAPHPRLLPHPLKPTLRTLWLSVWFCPRPLQLPDLLTSTMPPVILSSCCTVGPLVQGHGQCRWHQHTRTPPRGGKAKRLLVNIVLVDGLDITTGLNVKIVVRWLAAPRPSTSQGSLCHVPVPVTCQLRV